MQKIILILTSILFIYSCQSDDKDAIKNTYTDLTRKMEQPQSDSVIKKRLNEIEVLKYVKLENNRYYLDKEAAIKANLDKDAIELIDENMKGNNKFLDDQELYNKTHNVETENIYLDDFQKMDIDSFKKEYVRYEKELKKKPLNINLGYYGGIFGDLTTDGFEKKADYVYNPDYKKAYFRSHGKTWPISIYRYEAQSTLGGLIVKSGRGSAYTTSSATVTLYTNHDYLYVAFSCSDPDGCYAGYKLTY